MNGGKFTSLWIDLAQRIITPLRHRHEPAWTVRFIDCVYCRDLTHQLDLCSEYTNPSGINAGVMQ